MTEASSSEADSEDLVVIREVYDSDNAQEIFEMELERAIQSGCKTIIIEPTQLGEDTERWISYGNYLRRSAVVAGMASIMVGFYWEDKTFLPLPLGFTSSLCASLYTVCWAFDPCSLYKVEHRSATKRSSRKRQSSSSSKDSLVIPPVVIIRQNPSSRASNYTHIIAALASFTFCLWKIS